MKKSSRGVAKVLKALANYRRLDILLTLKKEKDLTVGDISEYIHLSFKSTSRHLAILAATSIIDKEQIGLEVYCKLSPDMPQLARYVLSGL